MLLANELKRLSIEVKRLNSGASEINKKCVLIGAGGHASVVMQLCHDLGYQLAAISPGTQQEIKIDLTGITCISDCDISKKFRNKNVFLVNGIGATLGSSRRFSIFKHFKELDYQFLTLVHEFCFVSKTSTLGEGVQIMAGAIVQNHCLIGHNTIINTRASVDHGAKIGAHCHIAPGAIICGDVEIGENCFIGAGAIIIEGTKLASGSVIRAGALIHGTQ